MLKLEKVVAVSAGTTAKDVEVRGLACLVQNNSDSATVYLREKRSDGTAASSSNGWRLAPGETLPFPVVAMTLSVVASAASTEVRVMILDEG